MSQFYLVYIICFPLNCLNQAIFLLTKEFGVYKLQSCNSKKLDHLKAVLKIIENRASLGLIGKTRACSSSWGMQMDRHLHLKGLLPRPVPPVTV